MYDGTFSTPSKPDLLAKYYVRQCNSSSPTVATSPRAELSLQPLIALHQKRFVIECADRRCPPFGGLSDVRPAVRIRAT